MNELSSENSIKSFNSWPVAGKCGNSKNNNWTILLTDVYQLSPFEVMSADVSFAIELLCENVQKFVAPIEYALFSKQLC